MRGDVRYTAAIVVALSMRDIADDHIKKKGGGLKILPRIRDTIHREGSEAMKNAAKKITDDESYLLFVKMGAMRTEIKKALGIDIDEYPQAYASFVVGVLSERITELNNCKPQDPRIETLETLSKLVARVWLYFSSRTGDTDSDHLGRVVMGIWEDVCLC